MCIYIIGIKNIVYYSIYYFIICKKDFNYFIYIFHINIIYLNDINNLFIKLELLNNYCIIKLY